VKKLWMLVFVLPATAGADPITIGDLTSDDDGSTDVITNIVSGREWLRWDVIPHLNFADTSAFAAENGWLFAGAADTQSFVDALFPGAPCTVAVGGVIGQYCGAADNLLALTGSNFTPGAGAGYAFFLSDNGVAREVGVVGSLDGVFQAYTENRSIRSSDLFADGGYFEAHPVSWLLFRDPVAVSEPGTLALFLIGLAGLAFVRRRRPQ